MQTLRPLRRDGPGAWPRKAVDIRRRASADVSALLRQRQGSGWQVAAGASHSLLGNAAQAPHQ
jgi:hypothetical protein